MKFTVTQENFNRGLLTVSHAAAKNANLPILNNILIAVEEGSIQLAATNLEIGVRSSVRGKIEHPGSFTVNSKLLTDYVGLLPNSSIEVALVTSEGGDGTLRVNNGHAETTMKGIPAADFPLIPSVERTRKVSCPTSELRSAISQVIFAVSQSETRPELNGVYLGFQGNELTLTATDSYRLAERKLRLLERLPQPVTVIVPARALQELLRVLGGLRDSSAIANVEQVALYVAENQILFAVGAVEITSRLIEGRYPDYQQIIPQQHTTTARIPTIELIKGVKAASLFSRSGIYDVAMSLSPERHEVVISAANAQLGENVSRLSAEVTGSENRTVLNYRYLLDGLQGIETEEVEVNIIDNASPCVIRPRGRTDYLYLVMPIKQ